MTVLSIIRDCLDALLHPSARYDALTRARHRAFMAPRLLGSLAAFAAFPVYLAMRGAPTALEVAAFAWLIAPILLSWFLSRTGRYEGAHMLSSLALAGLVMMVAVDHRRHRILCRGLAGGRSARSRAFGLAPRGRVCLGAGAVLRRAVDRARTFRHAAGAGSERGAARRLHGVRRGVGDALCRGPRVRRGIAGAHQRLAALCRGRPLSPAGAQHERRDFAPSAATARCSSFRPRPKPCWARRSRGCSGTACSTASMSPIVRPISRRLSDAARGGEARSVEFRLRRDRRPRRRAISGRFHLGRNAVPAARSSQASQARPRSSP